MLETSTFLRLVEAPLVVLKTSESLSKSAGVTKSLSVLVVPGVIGEPNLGSRLPARAFLLPRSRRVDSLLKVQLVAYKSRSVFTRLSNIGLMLVLQFLESPLQSFTFNLVVVGIIAGLCKCLGKTFMFSF